MNLLKEILQKLSEVDSTDYPTVLAVLEGFVAKKASRPQELHSVTYDFTTNDRETQSEYFGSRGSSRLGNRRSHSID